MPIKKLFLLTALLLMLTQSQVVLAQGPPSLGGPHTRLMSQAALQPIADVASGFTEDGWLSRQIAHWFQEQITGLYNGMLVPFSQTLPILLQKTPDLSKGITAVIFESMKSIGFGLIALLLTLGWGQMAVGYVLGTPFTPLQLLTRAAGASVMILGSLHVMTWILNLVDAIVGRLVTNVEAVFAPATPGTVSAGELLLFVSASLLYGLVLFGVRALLTFRLVDLALMMALSPIPIAFWTLPATSHLLATWVREFIAVASQTILFCVVIAFWDSIAMADTPAMPLTFLQHTSAFVLMAWYLWNKPNWLKAMVHSGSHDVGQGVMTALRTTAMLFR